MPDGATRGKPGGRVLTRRSAWLLTLGAVAPVAALSGLAGSDTTQGVSWAVAPLVTAAVAWRLAKRADLEGVQVLALVAAGVAGTLLWTLPMLAVLLMIVCSLGDGCI